eukprot:8139787-Pyramimonas_sp.AAC.2
MAERRCGCAKVYTSSAPAAAALSTSPCTCVQRNRPLNTTSKSSITSFYGSSCANNCEGALNTPETLQETSYIYTCLCGGKAVGASGELDKGVRQRGRLSGVLRLHSCRYWHRSTRK